jgi:transposase-like protein
MSATIKNQDDLNLSKVIENTSPPAQITQPLPADSQVKIRKQYSPRRSFDTAYKLRILSAYDACENASDRGALLRKEGLYHSRIYVWKKQLANAKSSDHKKQLTSIRTDNLAKENDQLKKKLAQAEAIIELQKKVSELFTTHILPHEINGEKS